MLNTVRKPSSRRIAPTNFYALFSPDVTPERQRRMADLHYFNPEEFYGEWMLPSIARNDPAYPEQNYWRGRVWAPLNFLVYLALARTELQDVRRDLAQNTCAFVGGIISANSELTMLSGFASQNA